MSAANRLTLLLAVALFLGLARTGQAATRFSVEYLSLTVTAQAMTDLHLGVMYRSQGLTLLPFYFRIRTPTGFHNWGIELYSNNQRVLGGVTPGSGIYRGLRERVSASESIPLYWQVYAQDQNVAAAYGTPQSVTATPGGLALYDNTLGNWGAVYDISDQDRIPSWDRERSYRTLVSAGGLGSYPQPGRPPVTGGECYVYFGGDLRNTTDTRQFVGQLTLDYLSLPSDYRRGGYATPNPVKPVRGERVFFNFSTNDEFAGITIHIFDLTGQPVATLKDTRYWDCRRSSGAWVEGGLYLYQIHVEGQIMSGTVVVIK